MPICWDESLAPERERERDRARQRRALAGPSTMLRAPHRLETKETEYMYERDQSTCPSVLCAPKIRPFSPLMDDMQGLEANQLH